MKQNRDKSDILALCTRDDIYLKRDYLNVVSSPYVRSIITKLRIDANKLNECRFRHYRKRSETSTCTHCGIPETVKHRLLICSKGNLVNIRDTFLEQYRGCVPDRLIIDSDSLLCAILNADPKCKPRYLDEMIGHICTFVKKA